MLKILHKNNILSALELLAEIDINLVKNSIIYVSMATIEATWLLGMFQLWNLEGY